MVPTVWKVRRPGAVCAWLALVAEGPTPLPEDPQQEPTGQEGPPPRLDLIERVRREIAEGVYDTPEKWEKALDRLLEKLERQ